LSLSSYELILYNAIGALFITIHEVFSTLLKISFKPYGERLVAQKKLTLEYIYLSINT